MSRVYPGMPRRARDGQFEVQLRDLSNNEVLATAHGATAAQAMIGARQLAVAMNEADDRERRAVLDAAMELSILGPGSSTSH
jgi:hypothetical protein